jgi:hypothetical protein
MITLAWRVNFRREMANVLLLRILVGFYPFYNRINEKSNQSRSGSQQFKNNVSYPQMAMKLMVLRLMCLFP